MNYDDPNDQRRRLMLGAPGGTAVAAPAAGAVPAAAPESNAPTATGSGFVNLQTYLNANRDKGAQMGQAIGGQLQSEGQAVDAAHRADLVDKSNMYAGKPDDPAVVAAKAADAQRQASHEQLYGKYEADKRLAGTQQGRAGMLQASNPGSGYSAGASQMDAFLVGQSPGAQAAIGAANAPRGPALPPTGIPGPPSWAPSGGAGVPIPGAPKRPMFSGLAQKLRRH